MNDNLITVIVTVYNREKYLRKCIASILDQAEVKLDIILVDDGSTDRSAYICDEYATKNRNIRVVHQQNKGLSSARNTGLEKAMGNYIVFVDDDDFLPRDSLKTLLALQIENNADLVIGNYAEYSNEGEYKQTFELPEKYCNKTLSNREVCELLFYSDRTHVLMASWGKIYKKEVWNNLRFDEDVPYAEDQFIFSRLRNRCKCIYLTDNVVYNQVFTNISLVRGPVKKIHLYQSGGILRVADYLLTKGYYDIALFKFGFGTRHLIYMKKMLGDVESQQEVKRQYRGYKKLAKRLFFKVNVRNKLRFILFFINFDLYGKIRESASNRG